MRFSSLESLLTRHPAPSFVAPLALAREVVRQLQHEDARALVIESDAPPVRIVSDRHVVDALMAARRDADALTALDLSVPIESFDGSTTLEMAWSRIRTNHRPWVAIRRGNRVIALLSRTQVLEWIVLAQEDEVDCAIGAVQCFSLANRRPSRAHE